MEFLIWFSLLKSLTRALHLQDYSYNLFAIHNVFSTLLVN
jgi:hypothetical protein